MDRTRSEKRAEELLQEQPDNQCDSTERRKSQRKAYVTKARLRVDENDLHVELHNLSEEGEGAFLLGNVHLPVGTKFELECVAPGIGRFRTWCEVVRVRMDDPKGLGIRVDTHIIP